MSAYDLCQSLLVILIQFWYRTPLNLAPHVSPGPALGLGHCQQQLQCERSHRPNFIIGATGTFSFTFLREWAEWCCCNSRGAHAGETHPWPKFASPASNIASARRAGIPAPARQRACAAAARRKPGQSSRTHFRRDWSPAELPRYVAPDAGPVRLHGPSGLRHEHSHRCCLCSGL